MYNNYMYHYFNLSSLPPSLPPLSLPPSVPPSLPPSVPPSLSLPPSVPPSLSLSLCPSLPLSLSLPPSLPPEPMIRIGVLGTVMNLIERNSQFRDAPNIETTFSQENEDRIYEIPVKMLNDFNQQVWVY